MGINLKIAFATCLILAIAGCTTESTPEATAPAPTAPPAAKIPKTTQSFNNPVVSTNQDVTNASATPNLIQSTSATERVVIVSQGRTDPFAQIIGMPVATSLQTTTATRVVPVLPRLPTAIVPRQPTRSTTATASRTPIAPNNVAQTSKSNPIQASVLPQVMPPVVPNPTLVSVLPPPPQPDLAKAVTVSGVVLIGKQPQAIIKVPNETSSRYVQAGQRLANGLLIKRIEMNEGSNPIVILEQYGIEVARMVGEETNDSTPSATTNVGNSVSMTTPQNPVTVGAS